MARKRDMVCTENLMRYNLKSYYFFFFLQLSELLYIHNKFTGGTVFIKWHGKEILFALKI